VSAAPENVDAYIAFGQLRMAQSRNAEAEEYFRRAVELQSNYWRAHHSLASFLYRTERYDESLAVYELVTALAPDVSSVFGGQGAAYWMKGDYENARIAYSRSVELKESPLGYTNTGLALYYEGKYERAAEMQLKALELAPKHHRYLGRLAESYRFVDGAEEQATEYYEKAVEAALENLALNESDWRTTGLLAVYVAHLDRETEARGYADRAVTMSSGDPEALYYQALVMHRFGYLDEVFEALEAAVAVDAQYRMFIASDPDLKSLSGDERYEALLP